MAANATQETTGTEGQYGLVKILGLWLAVAGPMGILARVITPAVGPDFESDPIGATFTGVGLVTLGLIWQFVLSMIIVYREEGDLRWATIRRRLWLSTPRDPKTGEPRRKLWLWLIPFALLLFTIPNLVGPPLDRLWVSVFPFLAAPAGSDLLEILGSPEILEQLVGNWSFLGLFVVLAVFNILGEEFIFRGVLLPRMEGVFGKWDWVANGVLMGAYHWHQPWRIPGSIVASIIAFSFPARRFRSTWMSFIVHSVQFVLTIPMILMVVLGLM